MTRLPYEYVDNLSETVYSQGIFGAQWLMSLQHGCLSPNLIDQNAF